MTPRSNILVFMVDQLDGTLFPDGPMGWLHAPNLKALAGRSTRFANVYTGSPLCAPGGASDVTGQLPHHTRVYDDAADFGWTPDYRRPGERIDRWHHNLGSAPGAGVAEISHQNASAAENDR